MKVSKRELQRIIREEKVRLRREDTLSASRKTGSISGDAGKKSRANRLRRLNEDSMDPQGAEDIVMGALEEYIDALAAGNSAVEIETLLTQLVGRAVDIAVRDKIIPARL